MYIFHRPVPRRFCIHRVYSKSFTLYDHIASFNIVNLNNHWSFTRKTAGKCAPTKRTEVFNHTAPDVSIVHERKKKERKGAKIEKEKKRERK